MRSSVRRAATAQQHVYTAADYYLEEPGPADDYEEVAEPVRGGQPDKNLTSQFRGVCW